MNRRDFLKLSGAGLLVAVAPAIVLAADLTVLEKLRRFWQVGRNAPVGDRRLAWDPALGAIITVNGIQYRARSASLEMGELYVESRITGSFELSTLDFAALAGFTGAATFTSIEGECYSGLHAEKPRLSADGECYEFDVVGPAVPL